MLLSSFLTFLFPHGRRGLSVSIPTSQLSTSQTPPIQLPLIGTLSSYSTQVMDWMACWDGKMNWPLFHPEEVSCWSGWKQGVERLAWLLSLSLQSSVAFITISMRHGFCFPVTGIQCRVQVWPMRLPIASFGMYFIVQHKVYKRALIWIVHQYLILYYLTW